MEFLNNRVPVIGTRLGGIIDFVDESNGYLFDPYDEEEINNLVNYLNNLTVDDIYKMKNSIKRTTLPSEHYSAMQKQYDEVIG